MKSMASLPQRVGSSVELSVPRRVDPRLVASVAAVYLIWSTTYLAMRIVVHDLPPLLSAGIRFACAGAVMLAIAYRQAGRLPPLADWKKMVPVGVLLCLGGNGCVSLAERTVSSSGAAVVCATMPLWVGVLGAATGARPTAREWLALVVGFVGVLVLFGGPSLAGAPWDLAFIVISPIAWALGSLLSRRVKLESTGSFAMPGMQMTTGAASLLVVGLLHGERVPLDAPAEAWGALAYLAVFGSLVAFTAYAWLLRHARPMVATSYAYVNPILATLIAAAFYGEPLGVSTLVANVLIVGAIFLGMTRKR